MISTNRAGHPWVKPGNDTGLREGWVQYPALYLAS
jgi:hypothetical protein